MVLLPPGPLISSLGRLTHWATDIQCQFSILALPSNTE